MRGALARLANGCESGAAPGSCSVLDELGRQLDEQPATTATKKRAREDSVAPFRKVPMRRGGANALREALAAEKLDTPVEEIDVEAVDAPESGARLRVSPDDLD